MRDKELTLEITNYREKSCPWCSSMSNRWGKHLGLNKVEECLDLYKKECDVVRLSGGEPLAHPDIPEIVQYAKERYSHVIVMTSGARKFAKLLDGVSYIVNMVDSASYDLVKSLNYFSKPVSMHVVMVRGNEDNFLKSVQLALGLKVPLRMLKVQEQGRARTMMYRCDMPFLSYTGEKGCDKDNKITVTHDGLTVTCSALKGKDKCDLWRHR